MSQSPYDDAGFGVDEVYAEPERTSIASVLGLICSIIGCCVPIGILGVVLGVFGLIGSSRSRGRVGGRGLAIAAIILGALNTAIWLGAVAAIGAALNQTVGQIAPGIVSIIEDADDQPDAARAALSPRVATNYSDAELLAFAEAVGASFGSVVSQPTAPSEFIGDFMAFMQSQAVQQYAGQQFIPIGVTFDQGDAFVIGMQQLGGQPGTVGIPIGDVHVVSGDGATIIRLSDFDTTPEGAPGAPASEVQPSEGDAEGDAEAGADDAEQAAEEAGEGP
ncbi:MAG: hypothetical protein AAF356_05005 [Planctomycetota bacterium]